MVNVEVCINCGDEAALFAAVAAACRGGAATVELCSAMEFDGLTPSREQMMTARRAFGQRPGLMVMVRPRPGDFCYSGAEIRDMHQQIDLAAESGADGVVLGVLDSSRRIDKSQLGALVEHCRSAGLRITFHRAFDATAESLEALEVLLDHGVDRVLTSGMPWGEAGTAVEGAGRLAQFAAAAGTRLEIVIAGGITPDNAGAVLRQLPAHGVKIAVHAYSGVLENGVPTVGRVRALCRAVATALAG